MNIFGRVITFFSFKNTVWIIVFIHSHTEQSLDLSININIDGIPLHKSSKFQFWPILMNIFEMPEIAPMTIAIFYGKSKPTNLDAFLNQMVDELTDVLKHGIMINGYKINVKLRCFICDSPARAFLKGMYHFIIDQHFISLFSTFYSWISLLFICFLKAISDAVFLYF